MIGIIVNCILQSAADRKTFQPEIKKTRVATWYDFRWPVLLESQH